MPRNDATVEAISQFLHDNDRPEGLTISQIFLNMGIRSRMTIDRALKHPDNVAYFRLVSRPGEQPARYRTTGLVKKVELPNFTPPNLAGGIVVKSDVPPEQLMKRQPARQYLKREKVAELVAMTPEQKLENYLAMVDALGQAREHGSIPTGETALKMADALLTLIEDACQTTVKES